MSIVSPRQAYFTIKTGFRKVVLGRKYFFGRVGEILGFFEEILEERLKFEMKEVALEEYGESEEEEEVEEERNDSESG